MAIVELIYDVKPLTYIAANPTKVLSNGEPIYYTNGQYSIGDGTTQLSSLPLYGGTGYTFTGTTSQYTRGDGTYATFPTNVSSFTNDSGYLTSAAIGVTVQGYSANTTLLGNSTTGSGSIVLGTSPTFTTNININNIYAGYGGGNINSNTAFGVTALNINSTGSNNTAFGNGALRLNTTSSSNTAIGGGALYSSTSANNTAIGYASLISLTTGGNNTAFGVNSAFSLQDGSLNTAVGMNALYNNVSGIRNTVIGYQAMYNSTSDYNIAIGYLAGNGITTGGKNTIIGSNLASLTSTTANNIILADGDGNIKFRWNASTSILTITSALSGVSPYMGSTFVFDGGLNNYVSFLAAGENGFFFGNSSSNLDCGIVANASTNLRGLAFRTGGNTTRLILNQYGNVTFSPGNQTSGAITDFTFTNSTNTGQTASTNIPNFRVTGSTKTWAAGALTNQYWNYFTANTAAFASASTITNSYGLYVEAATAGTNATITNNYAAGFSGAIKVTNNTSVIDDFIGDVTGSRRLRLWNIKSSTTSLTQLDVQNNGSTISSLGVTSGAYTGTGVLTSNTHFFIAQNGTAGNSVLYGANNVSMRIKFINGGFATSNVAFEIDNNNNIICGNAALATNATDGFLYLPSCAGVPTGVPTTITGKVPIVVDSTNNKAYIYSGGAWVALN